MRFGTRTDLGRMWTPPAVRPPGAQRIGYEYGYLSVAINPLRGEIFLLLLPDMRVESFQAFLTEFEDSLSDSTTLRRGWSGGALQFAVKVWRAIADGANSAIFTGTQSGREILQGVAKRIEESCI